MADLLSEIGRLLGITAPSVAVPQTIPTPAGPSGTSIAGPSGAPPVSSLASVPAAHPTFGQIFESPAVQGALNAYLGYLAAPRGGPRWQRLGIGGLEGLQGFQQAEARQTQLPMQQAQLQSAQAQAQLEKGKAAAYAGHPEYFKPKEAYLAEQSRNLHATLLHRAQDPSLPPQLRKAYMDYADYVASTPTQEHPYKELEGVLKNPLELENLKAGIGLKEALTGQVGKAKPELGIDTETGAVIDLKPGVKHATKLPEAPPPPKPPAPGSVAHTAATTEKSLLDAYSKLNPPPGTLGSYVPGAMEKWRAGFEEYKRTHGGGGGLSATGGTHKITVEEGGPSPGATPVGEPGTSASGRRVQEYKTPSGGFEYRYLP